MATFQKRNGRVTATVRIKPHKPKSKTFDTLRDAKKWAQEVEVILLNEKQQIYDHVLLKDALEEYRDNVSIKKKSVHRETSRINFIIKNMKCDIPLADIDKNFLVSWREWRLETVSSSTARRDLLLLKAVFSWCIETKLWLGKNPVQDIQLPKEANHRERIISQTEIDLLCDNLPLNLKDIFLLAIETGMRQAEICGLTWDRVYLDQRFVKLLVTKNGKPREVALSQKALDILSKRSGEKSGSVFNISPLEVSTEFMKIRIAAGMYGFTFHDTRHTAATRIALKIPLLDLCKMFGWSDPKRAMVYYNPTASEIALRL